MRLIDYTLLIDALKDISPSLTFNEPMHQHNTFRIGGVAAITVTPSTLEELSTILTLHKEIAPALPFCVIGKGSNAIFPDEGYDGLVILTTELQNVSYAKPELDGYVTVSADCGVSLTLLARQCVADNRSLSGLAFAFGIPGTVGGAVVMNAGAYGGEMSDVVYAVDYFDPQSCEVKRVFRHQLNFSYRHSLFSDHPEYVVMTAYLRLKPDDREAIISEMSRNMTSRRLKQPLELPNAGSIFKRPEGTFAGKLIEESGLKGYTVGGAQVSEKHAGFIVNTGGATYKDVCTLISHIRDIVYQDHGIALECEIKLISSEPSNQ